MKTLPANLVAELTKALTRIGEGYNLNVGHALAMLGTDRNICVTENLPLPVATLTVIGKVEVERLLAFAHAEGGIVLDSRDLDKRGVN